MPEHYVTHAQLHDSALWQTLHTRRYPSVFTLELTARCNLNCRHCYLNLPANDRIAREGEMTLAEIEDLANQAVQLGALWCLLTGGDPLLREDFAEIYLTLKRRGLLVSVYTNATLITEAHVRLWREYPPRDLEVTVYGATPETFERITRRPGSHTAFLRGLQRLREADIPVRLKAMAMRSNIYEFPAIAEFCLARTKDYFRYDPFLHLRVDGDPERNAMIQAERLSPVELVAFEHAIPERFAAWEKVCEVMQYGQTCDPERLFHCGIGKGAFSVGWDGRFRPCLTLVAPGTTYDLRQRSLREAWEQFTPTIRTLRATNRDFSHTCGSCEKNMLCHWCPAKAYLEVGTLDGFTPYFCDIAHVRERAFQATGALS